MPNQIRDGISSVEKAAAPASPAAGKRLLYPKSDGWYQKDSAGVESMLASGGASLSAAQTWTATQTHSPASASGVPIISKGLASQTGDLHQFQDNNAVVLAAVNSVGQFLEGGRRLARLTSRLTTNAASLLTTMGDTGLQLDLQANKVYEIRAHGHWRSGTATNGIGIQLTTGGVAITGTRHTLNVLNNQSPLIVTATAMQVAALQTAAAVINTDYLWTIDGIIRTGVSAVTLKVQYRAEVATNTSTIMADSYLTAQEMA